MLLFKNPWGCSAESDTKTWLVTPGPPWSTSRTSALVKSHNLPLGCCFSFLLIFTASHKRSERAKIKTVSFPGKYPHPNASAQACPGPWNQTWFSKIISTARQKILSITKKNANFSPWRRLILSKPAFIFNHSFKKIFYNLFVNGKIKKLFNTIVFSMKHLQRFH